MGAVALEFILSKFGLLYSLVKNLFNASRRSGVPMSHQLSSQIEPVTP